MISSTTDFPAPPAHGYRGDSPREVVTQPRGLSVAISRQAGARGSTIARKVGELLSWQVYDNETLDFLVQDDTAREQFLAELPTAARVWAASQLARLRRTNTLNADPDTISMIELLLAVGARGDAVIVGRGAGFLLPVESTVHVRVVASQESRVSYLAQWLRLSREEAVAELLARDQRRAQFLTATLGRELNDPTGYDMVVNVDRLGVEGTAQFIGWAVRTKQMFAEIREADEKAAALDDVPGA